MPDRLQAGKDLEPIGELWFRRECDDDWLPDGWGIQDPGDFTLVWANEPNDWAFCTPDRFIINSNGTRIACLELKCLWWPMKMEDSLRKSYRAQLQWTMMCTGMSRGYYAVVADGLNFKWYVEDRNNMFINRLLKRGAAFLWRVKNNSPPPIDYRQATASAISRRYPKAHVPERQLTNEGIKAAEELYSLEAKRKEVDRAIKQRQSQLKAEIGDAEFGRIDQDKGYYWKPNKNGVRSIRFGMAPKE